MWCQRVTDHGMKYIWWPGADPGFRQGATFAMRQTRNWIGSFSVCLSQLKFQNNVQNSSKRMQYIFLFSSKCLDISDTCNFKSWTEQQLNSRVSRWVGGCGGGGGCGRGRLSTSPPPSQIRPWWYHDWCHISDIDMLWSISTVMQVCTQWASPPAVKSLIISNEN